MFGRPRTLKTTQERLQRSEQDRRGLEKSRSSVIAVDVDRLPNIVNVPASGIVSSMGSERHIPVIGVAGVVIILVVVFTINSESHILVVGVDSFVFVNILIYILRIICV
jgi:hypothetical protein